jgi:hypothetical protein
MTNSGEDETGSVNEAGALLRGLEPYARDRGVSADLAQRIEGFGRASGVDPDNVLVLHVQTNPATGQSMISSWPCPQCVALGRTDRSGMARTCPTQGP